MRTIHLAGAAAAAAGLAAATIPALAADAEVRFTCCSYRPAEIRITEGQSVTFAPDSGSSFDEHPLDFVAPSIADQRTGTAPATRTFSAKGTYRYFCTLHGAPDAGMAGRVVVEAAPVTTTPTTSTTATTTTGETPPPGTFPGTTGTDTTGGPPAITPVPSTATRTPPPTVRLAAPAAVRVSTLRGRGLPVRVRVDRAARLTATLKAGPRTLARASRRALAAGELRLRLRAPAGLRTRRATAALRVVAVDAGGRRTARTAQVALRR